MSSVLYLSLSHSSTPSLIHPNCRRIQRLPQVNGVLRNLATQRDRLQTPYEDPTLTPLAALAIATSTPDWLLAALSESGLLDFDELGEWARATQQRPQLALRINTLRTNRAVVAQRLRDVGCALTEGAVAPLPECVVVEASGRAVDALPGFADGDFTVQDVGAQCVALLAAPSAGDLVLDLCAAPGGKTCHLAELMRDHGTLVAVELRPHRAERITENSKRLGLTCVHVVAADASDGDALSAALREHAGDHDGKGGTPLADCVVLDAPCSGSGTLRRNPEYRYRTGAEEPSKLRDGSLVALQANMLDAAARCVAVGGTLTYSVCSPLAAETTEAVAAFLGRHAAFEVVPVDAPALLPYAADCTSLGGARTCLRTWSHRHPADSHFACKMVRRHPSTAAVPVASPSQP